MPISCFSIKTSEYGHCHTTTQLGEGKKTPVSFSNTLCQIYKCRGEPVLGIQTNKLKNPDQHQHAATIIILKRLFSAEWKCYMHHTVSLTIPIIPVLYSTTIPWTIFLFLFIVLASWWYRRLIESSAKALFPVRYRFNPGVWCYTQLP